MKRWMMVGIAAALVTGCNVHVAEHENGHGSKNVEIESPLGALKLRTDNVDPKDAGMAVYPGARLKPEDKGDKDQGRANVDIDTPWVGLKVVAVTMLSDDPPQKLWDFYKKDLSQYGSVLECKKGSPDMEKKRANDHDLICRNDPRGQQGWNVQVGTEELKVGTAGTEHIVAIKPSEKGSEFTLVYIRKREKKDSM